MGGGGGGNQIEEAWGEGADRDGGGGWGVEGVGKLTNPVSRSVWRASSTSCYTGLRESEREMKRCLWGREWEWREGVRSC